MNAGQRKKLLKAKLIIEEVLEEEENKLHNLPENLEGSTLAISIEDAISWLEEARDSLNEVGV